MYIAVVQFLLSVTLVTGLAVFPPEEGAMTVISLNGAKKSDLVEFARENDLKIIGNAAFPNAVTVWGRRPGVAKFWNSGNVAVTGSFIGCAAEGADQ